MTNPSDPAAPAVPPEVSLACRDWQLTGLAPLAQTRTGLLWRAQSPHGPAVLKLIRPEEARELPGIGLLDWWHGTGAARLYAHRGNLALMEWLEGPSAGDLTRAGRDFEAAGALVEVILQLHRPRNFAPEGLCPLDDWLRPLTESSVLSWPVKNRADMAMAAGVARRLLASSPAPFPLHGDLHHDNILKGAGAWKAIDPKGLWGDPAFDAANSYRNPEGSELLCRSYDRIAMMARLQSERLGHPQLRLLGWAAVQAALSACWSREDGLPAEPDLLLLPRLLAAYAAAPEG